MRVTMLGCGASTGVPSLGNGWGVCDPDEPRNRRKRCAIAVESGGRTILVDTPPEIREQMFDNGITDIDAVLFTHIHADHTHGIDDLRPLHWRREDRIPVYSDKQTFDDLFRRFDYMFEESPLSPPHFRAPLVAHEIEEERTYEIAGMKVDVRRQDHGSSGESLGFVFDDRFAYSTDVKYIPESELERLADLKLELWIVDCLREEGARAHAILTETLEWIERVKPKRAYLTHMNSQLDYATTLAKCPEGVEPGYDGLVVEI